MGEQKKKFADFNVIMRHRCCSSPRSFPRLKGGAEMILHLFCYIASAGCCILGDKALSQESFSSHREGENVAKEMCLFSGQDS
jgi:hypothetical protein